MTETYHESPGGTSGEPSKHTLERHKNERAASPRGETAGSFKVRARDAGRRARGGRIEAQPTRVGEGRGRFAARSSDEKDRR